MYGHLRWEFNAEVSGGPAERDAWGTTDRRLADGQTGAFLPWSSIPNQLFHTENAHHALKELSTRVEFILHGRNDWCRAAVGAATAC
jgi:hypothetical protein